MNVLTLSPRRLEAVRLMAESAMGNNEIAARLGITPRTVKAHLAYAFLKTGCRSRIELMLRWHSGLREELTANA